MAVIMISEVPGADAALLDGLVEAGVPTAMANAPGFVSHVSGATGSGVRVVEVWETPDHHRAWLEDHIRPNLPPGVVPGPIEYIEVALTVPGD